jgi:prephenate dehydratase
LTRRDETPDKKAPHSNANEGPFDFSDASKAGPFENSSDAGGNMNETKETPSPRMRVAFQGEPGAFSNEAARRLVGDDVLLAPCTSFEQMFAMTENGLCDFCVAPIENSLFGSVYQNYDLLIKHHLHIVGETNLRIVHNLIAAPGTELEVVRRVYSHPVALGQCTNFFSAHPDLQPITAYDTAGSVKMILENHEQGAAAIASAAAADVYGARILLEAIEDDRQNYTRFLLLAHEPDQAGDDAPADDVRYKTSISFSLDNEVGSLFRAMAVFALRELDLTKIESRPLIGYPWEYRFYLDFIGHTADLRVRNALAHLGEFAANIRILGCYERAPKMSGD